LFIKFLDKKSTLYYLIIFFIISLSFSDIFGKFCLNSFSTYFSFKLLSIVHHNFFKKVSIFLIFDMYCIGINSSFQSIVNIPTPNKFTKGLRKWRLSEFFKRVKNVLYNLLFVILITDQSASPISFLVNQLV